MELSLSITLDIDNKTHHVWGTVTPVYYIGEDGPKLEVKMHKMCWRDDNRYRYFYSNIESHKVMREQYKEIMREFLQAYNAENENGSGDR